MGRESELSLFAGDITRTHKEPNYCSEKNCGPRQHFRAIKVTNQRICCGKLRQQIAPERMRDVVYVLECACVLYIMEQFFFFFARNMRDGERQDFLDSVTVIASA